MDNRDDGDAEPILDPDLAIVDTHHHLWDAAQGRYLFDDFLADIRSGHNITKSVFVECDAMYRQGGPVHERSMGEAEFVSGLAAMSASGNYGPTGLCSGYVGYVDFRWGDLVDPALEGLIEASGRRLRGIRQAARWQSEELYGLPANRNPQGLLLDPQFRQGFASLAKYGLCYDAWQLHMQLGDLLDLARAFPDTTISICHLGGPVGTGSYAGRRAEVFADWSASMRQLSLCENVVVKLGGLGMPYMGFGFERSTAPVTSDRLAEAWRPYIEFCIETFGPDRCMFESNYPVDGVSASYRAIWNAFKRITAGCSADDKRALFSGTAERVYRLGSS